jgi:HK97 family phage major capsid protein
VSPATRRLLERRIIGRDRHGRPIYAIAGGSQTATEPTAPTTAPEITADDLRGKTPEELVKVVATLGDKIRALHQTPEGEVRILEEHEQRAMAILLEVRSQAMSMIEEHNKIADALRTKPQSLLRATVHLLAADDDPGGNIRGLAPREARDRALRVLESRDHASHLDAEQKEHVERQVRRDSDIAKRILVTENEDYRNAWMKLMTNPGAQVILTEGERQALLVWEEYRAMSENVTTAGGFGIPVFIDPSVILTAQGSGNPFLELAQQIPVNTNVWKGVSSAGVSWSFDTEGTEVSDDSPTLAQPTVTVHMARGFIPFSIEVGQDYPGFADQMGRLLAEGYDELLVDKFTRGTGTGEPQGILTALSANTNVRVKVTTGGQLGSPDPYKVWEALGQRFRRRASWLMNVNVNDAIRQLGTANVYHAYTINLPDDWADSLFRRPVFESPYMPNTTTNTTDTSGYAVVGDFSNYVVARRGGMATELVPTLVGTNHRPTGQRGIFAYARIGGASVNDLAFRLLVNF